jgi:hypothetical protein
MELLPCPSTVMTRGFDEVSQNSPTVRHTAAATAPTRDKAERGTHFLPHVIKLHVIKAVEENNDSSPERKRL